MLDKFDKKNSPFKVPKQYFETFNVEMMDKLPSTLPTKKVVLWKKLLPWAAVAAIFCGVVFSTGVLQNNRIPNGSATALSSSDHVTTASDDEDFYEFLQEESTSVMYSEVMYKNH